MPELVTGPATGRVDAPPPPPPRAAGPGAGCPDYAAVGPVPPGRFRPRDLDGDLERLLRGGWEPGYAEAAARSPAPSAPARVVRAARAPEVPGAQRVCRRSWARRLVLPVVLALLALLVATGVERAATTAGDRDHLAGALRAEVERRDAANAVTTGQVGALRDRVRTTRDQRRQAERDQSAARALLSALGPVSGDVAVRGPGARIELADGTAGAGAGGGAGDPRSARPGARIRDHDLSDLVNVLWSAGAEAIAVNGARLTTLSAIRAAGDLILVGFVPVTAPYQITAIGDRGVLVRRLEESAVVDRLRHRPGSPVTSLTVAAVADLTLPAAELQVLRHAQRSGS